MALGLIQLLMEMSASEVNVCLRIEHKDPDVGEGVDV